MLNSARSTWCLVNLVAACLGCLAGCSDEHGPSTSEPDAGQFEGQLRRVISDGESGPSRFDYFLELANEAWLALELTAEPDFEPNRAVVVRGSWDGAVLHVDELVLATPAQEARLGSVQAPLVTPTPKRVAVVLFNFSNDTSQPIDTARAKELVFSGASSSNAYYQEVSFDARSLTGVVDMTGDVFGWYTLEQPNTGACAYQTWGSAARAKAQAAGVDLSGYDHVVHYFPRVSACSFSGVAQLPGRYSWIKQSGSQTIAHELGHNFGVHHASSYRCVLDGVPVAIGGTCSTSEYGDPFDVMGTGYRHFSAFHKEKLGFLDTVNVQTVSASGSFELVPLEQTSAGLQALRFPIPGTSDSYYVEYRQPFGFDDFSATTAVANGVLVRRVTSPASGARQTKLLDMKPSTSSVGDAALVVGQTFDDPAGNVAITLTARTASAASVEIIVDGLPPPPPSPCAEDEMVFEGHCYFATSVAQNFNGARSSCAARGEGWAIVSLESAAENDFVASLLGAAEHWVSGRDFTTEGTFVWATGLTFWSGGLSGSAPADIYANFLPGEPNGTGDCLRIVPGGQWRDAGCPAAYRAICEK